MHKVGSVHYIYMQFSNKDKSTSFYNKKQQYLNTMSARPIWHSSTKAFLSRGLNPWIYVLTLSKSISFCSESSLSPVRIHHLSYRFEFARQTKTMIKRDEKCWSSRRTMRKTLPEQFISQDYSHRKASWRSSKECWSGTSKITDLHRIPYHCQS